MAVNDTCDVLVLVGVLLSDLLQEVLVLLNCAHLLIDAFLLLFQDGKLFLFAFNLTFFILIFFAQFLD